ncbi:prenyltransferase/squalene oxidase repeat-containing protein [Geoglobus acetivorans]|uniref:Prenyltransferase alpha-alpha toroid domain-containing protein n=1 Tax=Geoglobus acetivorans TaxID=565033 RepID=A0ABZ3H406_GEOAI|nr:hypothetical protein [Geoglobus acetivorans]
MNKKSVLLVSILLFLTVMGIKVNLNSEKESGSKFSNHDFFESNWTENTIRLIRASRTVDGGYAGFNTKPELHSTYYFVMISDFIGLEPLYRQRTVKYLEGELEKFNTSKNTLEDLYYISKSLYYLDKARSYEHRSKIMGLLNSYQAESGGFANAVGGVPTGFANLAASELMGLYQIPSEKFYEYMYSKYLNNSYMRDLFHLEEVIVSLHNIGVDVKRLPNIDQRKDYLNEVKKEILSLKELKKSGNLAYVLAYLNVASILNESPGIPDEVIRYIISQQNRDGGFGFDFSPVSNEFGTYVALKIIAESGYEIPNREKIAELVTLHELPTGGYTPIVRGLAAAKYTYYAVSILKDLNESYDKSVETFFEHRFWEAVEDLKSGRYNFDFYPSIAGLTLLGKAVERDVVIDACMPYVEMFASGELDNLQVFYECMTALKLVNTTLKGDTMDKIIERIYGFERDGYFCIEKDCNIVEAQKETMEFIEVLNYLNAEPKNKESLVEWLKSQQNSDGGFGLDNKSNILSTYFVVKSLKILGETPENPDGVLEFLERCKRKVGGFSFTAEDEKPTIITTYYGVKTARLIEGGVT